MENFEQDDLIDFLVLTSDEYVRRAAWPLDDWKTNGGKDSNYEEVTHQDNPPAITIRTGLLASAIYNDESKVETKMFVQDLNQRSEHIESLKMKVRSHKIYLWLNSNDHFKLVERRFHTLRKKTKSEKILSEFAEIRLYRIIALGVGSRLLAERVGFKSKHASSKQIKQASGHAIKLNKLLSEGVRLTDWEDQKKLKDLLERLSLELQVANRKPKGDKNFENRKCLEGIAKEMLLTFDKIFSASLLDLAGMIGWIADSSTIDRIVQRVKINHRLTLARALRTHP